MIDYPELWEELFQNALAGSAGNSNIGVDHVVLRAELIADKAYPRLIARRKKLQDEAIERFKEKLK